MNEELFFEELCQSTAPSGLEYKVHPVIKKYFKDYCDIEQDDNYNLYMKQKGKSDRNIMLMAHMDEISIVITEMLEDGFLRFRTIGIDPNILPGQEVIIHGKRDFKGIINGNFNKEDYSNAVKIADLFIDTGYTREYIESNLKVGDRATLIGDFNKLLGNRITSKATDDRAGIVTMFYCAKELKHNELNVVYVASCQEEVGHRGAKMASYNVKADIGIAIDVTFDSGKFGDEERENELGNGPIICIGPNNHPKIRKKLIEIAKKYKIPFGVEVEPGNTGSDAWDIQVSRGGVPTVLVSIPIKYMHTTVEVIDIEDIRNTGRLLARFIEEVKLENLEELIWF